MRDRGVIVLRRGANGRFWPVRMEGHAEGARVIYSRYRLMSGSFWTAIIEEGGRSERLTDTLKRQRRGACMNVDEEAVRQLAQLIWETEGQPEGQEARHWEMATKLAESAAMAPVRTPHRHAVDTLFPEPDVDDER